MTLRAMFGRDREADPDVALRCRDDLRIDPDKLSVQVDERAAGVPLVDGRVGLEEVLVAAVANRRSALRADDAHRHRLADAERIANRQHDVADLHLVGVTQRERREVRAPRP